jgi:hypothetical protein
LHWQSLVKGVEKSGDQPDGDSDAIAAQVMWRWEFYKTVSEHFFLLAKGHVELGYAVCWNPTWLFCRCDDWQWRFDNWPLHGILLFWMGIVAKLVSSIIYINNSFLWSTVYGYFPFFFFFLFLFFPDEYSY